MEYIRNKKATFDYTLLETIEAGIELLGSEVQSVKHAHGTLTGAYISAVGGELWLLGAHIPAWQEKNTSTSFDPYRSRKLLVHKKEYLELQHSIKQQKLTVIPLSLYSNNGKIKIAIALAKGKKNFNKRESLRDAAVKRDIDRSKKGIE